MFQPAAIEKFLKFPLHVTRQFFALFCHKRCERRVILVDELIEKGLLRPVTLVTTSIHVLAATWGMIRILAILCFYTVYRSAAGS